MATITVVGALQYSPVDGQSSIKAFVDMGHSEGYDAMTVGEETYTLADDVQLDLGELSQVTFVWLRDTSDPAQGMTVKLTSDLGEEQNIGIGNLLLIQLSKEDNNFFTKILISGTGTLRYVLGGAV